MKCPAALPHLYDRPPRFAPRVALSIYRSPPPVDLSRTPRRHTEAPHEHTPHERHRCASPTRPTRLDSDRDYLHGSAPGSWVYFPSFFQTEASGADEAAAATLLQVAWRLHKAYAAVHAADAAVHAAATKLQRAARRHLQGRCNKPWRPSNLSLSLSLSLSPRLKSSRPLCQPTTGRCRSPRSCSNACRPLG
jgi:hypothetical protein